MHEPEKRSVSSEYVWKIDAQRSKFVLHCERQLAFLAAGTLHAYVSPTQYQKKYQAGEQAGSQLDYKEVKYG